GDLRVAVQPVTLGPADLPPNIGCPPGDYVKLAVSDSGPGMDAATKARIFEPYFTTKGVGKGSGMGLAVVHGIVERHQGFVTVDSAPGKGATFTVYFPRSEAPSEEEAGETGPPPGGSEHVLLVDDEEGLAKLGKATLEKLGYRVTTTGDPLEALEMVRSDGKAIDLLITDQTMPHLAGDELARRVLAIRPHLPIILATGFSSRVDEEKAREIGISHFIAKPFSSRELAHTVRMVLDRERS
nr:response regulator [Desulfobacteraceae bacterium]